MNWSGFLRWLRPELSSNRRPDAVQSMTPEELTQRRRRSANRNMFGVQIFDPPPPRPYRDPWSDEDRDDGE
ncbi:MAG: hypothetical protein ACYDHN_03780 [Solirubrobacteraceae bacterium]